MNRNLLMTLCLATLILMSASCAAAVQPPKAATVVAVPVEPAAVPPEIRGIVGDAQLAPSTEGTLTCVDNDDKAGKLTYSWSIERGTIKGEGKQVKWVAPESMGEYKITVTATNGHGDKASFSRTVLVIQNPYGKNPEDTTVYLKLVIPSSQAAAQSRRVQAMTIADIQCTVSGADPKDLSYTWKTTGGKLTGDGIQDGKADRVGWLAPGTQDKFTVTVTVSDKNGRSATGQIDFDVYLIN